LDDIHALNGKLRLDSFFPAEENLEFVHYNGSLTTPNCDEAVQWMVLKERQCVSTAQMSVLRTRVADPEGKPFQNRRPIQAANGRVQQLLKRNCNRLWKK